MRKQALAIIVGAAAIALLTGCQSKFTKQRFEMIAVGTDEREDVRNILGAPTSDLDEQWFYDDLDRHYSALIHFDQDGKVAGKEWMDASTGAWEGRNPNANEPPQGEVRERRKTTRRIDKD
jgi:outer membrane protein assembly factor BamE (lipoprotein component of BamABCDE complex)